MKPLNHKPAPPPPPRPVALPSGPAAAQPANQPPRTPESRSVPGGRLLLLLGGAVLGILLLFSLLQLALERPGAAREADRPAAAATPAAAETALPAASGDAAQSSDALAGQEALAAQDWTTAIAAFRRALESDPDNPLLREQMAESYVGFARKLIKDAPDEGLPRPVEALGTIRQTFEYSPTHAYARALEQRLALYLEAEASAQQANWPAAIASLQRLHAIQAEGFLESRQRLYDAYLGLADAHRREGRSAEVREACEQAAAVEGVDTATARECLQGADS